jgi:hypothetical protein
MPRFIFRDHELVPDGGHPFHSMQRVRVRADAPQLTATRVLEAGLFPYLQFLYDDGPFDFPSHEIRRAFWRQWMDAFTTELAELGASPEVVCIEHPNLGWDRTRRVDHRFTPEYQAIFEWGIEEIEAATGATVAQFGVPANSMVLYELPLPPNVAQVEPREYQAAWVNLPGQWAFRSRTTRDEFRMHLAICRALRVENVLLWSNPAEAERELAEEQMDWVLLQIEEMFPEPPPVDPKWWMPGEEETFDELTKRLASVRREASR